jgi:hypothetical protein
MLVVLVWVLMVSGFALLWTDKILYGIVVLGMAILTALAATIIANRND